MTMRTAVLLAALALVLGAYLFLDAARDAETPPPAEEPAN